MPSGESVSESFTPIERIPRGTRVRIVGRASGHGYPDNMEALVQRYNGNRNVYLADPNNADAELGGGYVFPEDIARCYGSRREEADYLLEKVTKFEGLAKEFKNEAKRLMAFETDTEELAYTIATLQEAGSNATEIHKILMDTGKFKG